MARRGRISGEPAPAEAPKLEDGSRIAVVGAGPAGTMFSYFLLNMAETIGLELDVDIYEPRRFTHCGPAGCNHCGGVISESLVQRLATEGIMLPEEIIQRGLDSYVLHTDVGMTGIETPLQEKRIAAVYRGNGPRTSTPADTHSFDSFLLQMAEQRGARLVESLVSDVRQGDDAMRVVTADGSHAEYDLVVVAAGINSRLLDTLEHDRGQFRQPDKGKTFICEFDLGEDVVRSMLGASMHVFLLDIPRLEFAALVPKGRYVTLCMLGDDIDDALMRRFFEAPEVKNCFPDSIIPPHVCHCYPRINVKAARPVYGDRLVMIGDSGATRLFKDGIGAAYRTSKAAAKTVIFHGISAEDFRNHYWPLCRRIDNDNKVGKLVFAFAGLIQKSRFARRGVLKMTIDEQRNKDRERRMSGVLWDLFSGSASYTDVFLRTLHPAYLVNLAWNLVAANLPGRWPRGDDASEGEHSHVGH